MLVCVWSELMTNEWVSVWSPAFHHVIERLLCPSDGRPAAVRSLRVGPEPWRAGAGASAGAVVVGTGVRKPPQGPAGGAAAEGNHQGDAEVRVSALPFFSTSSSVKGKWQKLPWQLAEWEPVIALSKSWKKDKSVETHLRCQCVLCFQLMVDAVFVSVCFRLYPVGITVQRYPVRDIVLQNYHVPAGVRRSHICTHAGTFLSFNRFILI